MSDHPSDQIADSKYILVTSANLTGHALRHNLETGVAVTSRHVATAFVSAIDTMIDQGTITQDHL